MKKTLLLLPLVLLCNGCTTTAGRNLRLPEISASEIYIKHQNPLFSAQIEADNVVDHGDYVTADKVSYDRDGRFTTTTVIVKGYRRDKATPQD